MYTEIYITQMISTVARNSGNCNLIGRVGYYDCMVTYM